MKENNVFKSVSGDPFQKLSNANTNTLNFDKNKQFLLEIKDKSEKSNPMCDCMYETAQVRLWAWGRGDMSILTKFWQPP